tara:strand:+ start:376 stop:2214 length:1839 start_codon:yes stop_codon:yes gene_type:complete
MKAYNAFLIGACSSLISTLTSFPSIALTTETELKDSQNVPLNLNEKKSLPLKSLETKDSDLFDNPIIPNPNLLNLQGPRVSLIFKKSQAKQAFEYLLSKSDYGFVWVQADPTYKSNSGQSPNSLILNENNSTISYPEPLSSQIGGAPLNEGGNTADSQRLITLNLKDITYSEAFNALIIASGLQAKLVDNIIYIGPNVRSTVFAKRQTRIHQLNQVSANSAADYLANLGASVTKTYTIKTSVTEGATQSESVEGGLNSSTTTEQVKTSVSVYGSNVGPLLGLLATTDDRLQKVTLIGDLETVDLAVKYLYQLDKRNSQVALTVQILDINASNTDILSNSFSKLIGNTFIVNDAGNLLTYFGSKIPPKESTISTDPMENPGFNYLPQEFIDVLSARIVSADTKVLASPTLMLSEFPGDAGGESVSFSSISSALNTGTIGRAKGNEAFVIVGNQVPINAKTEEGSSVCSYEYGLEGLTFGARILGIDDNDFVTFTISPAVSGVSETRGITGCGDISLLTTRRLDTGNIRVKDGNTLILTGVLNESETLRETKIPILGSLPLLGSAFRSSSKSNEKRELVILVTPRIVKDINNNLNSYGFKPSSNETKKLIENNL